MSSNRFKKSISTKIILKAVQSQATKEARQAARLAFQNRNWEAHNKTALRSNAKFGLRQSSKYCTQNWETCWPRAPCCGLSRSVERNFFEWFQNGLPRQLKHHQKWVCAIKCYQLAKKCVRQRRRVMLRGKTQSLNGSRACSSGHFRKPFSKIKFSFSNDIIWCWQWHVVAYFELLATSKNRGY